MKCLFVVCAFFALAHAKNELYTGWKSYYVGPPTAEQLQPMGKVFDQFQVDPLSHPIVQREGLVLVPPTQTAGFESALEIIGVPFKLHSADVKQTLDKEDVLFAKRKMETLLKNGGKHLPYNDYHDWPAIEAYMIEMANKYPNLVEMVIPAQSFEGRNIRYLKISTTGFADTSKPVIFIDGGIHAREWISPPTVTYVIHMLLEGNADADLLNDYDWIILPVVNPDGYQHTFLASRFWRKTRSTDTNSLSPWCPGVDGNRNYDFFWNTVGTSAFVCTDTYAGNQAFSEIETRVVRDILLEYLPRIPLYLTMHSYGSMILYPWGHDGSLSSNAFNLHIVGTAMAEAIDREAHATFPSYIVGNSVLVIGYPAAGAAEDYAHVIGVPLSYTYELPGLHGGYDGFHLDPVYIENVCKETWEGIKVGVRRAGALYG